MKIFRTREVLWGVLAIVFVSVLVIAVGERHDAVPVEAQTQLAELEGWAWDGDNIPSPGGGGTGWISFNSSNNPGGSPQPFAVTYNTVTGALGGRAWSSSIGWLSFDRSETFTPPSPDVCSGVGSTACIQGAQLVGWARFLTACTAVPCTQTNSYPNRGGWDGWVRLSGLTTGNQPYGVSVGSLEFGGQAWGSDSVGWIYFAHPTLGCSGFCVKKKYDFSLHKPADISVIKTQSKTNVIEVETIAGDPQLVTLSAVVKNNPAGVSVSLSPVSCLPDRICTTTATVTTTGAAIANRDEVIEITGTASGLTHKTDFKVYINDIPGGCLYNLSNSGDITVDQGDDAVVTIRGFLSPGYTCPQVPLSASGQPSTANPSPAACALNVSSPCTSTVTLQTAGVTPRSYPITVTGNPAGGPVIRTDFNLIVRAICAVLPCVPLGDFTLKHRPYDDGEPSLDTTDPRTVSHPHFVRDISIATSHSTNTFLRVEPIGGFADTVKIEIVDVKRDDIVNSPPGNAYDICVGFGSSFGPTCPADGIGDGAVIPLNQFAFKFNERVGTSISGVQPNVPVLFNVIRQTAEDVRYVIHLQASATSDSAVTSDTYIVLVIGASTPGYTEI